MLRWAACAAVLAMMVPGPAEAQLGKFLKKRIKEKIVEAVLTSDDSAAQAPAPSGPASSAQGPTKKAAPAPAVAPAPAPRATKEVAPAQPTLTPAEQRRSKLFNEHTLEMTAEVLDRFEKGLAAEAAELKAIAPQLARVLPSDQFEKCLQARVYTLPEWRKAYDEYSAVTVAASNSGDFSKTGAAAEKYKADLGRIAEPACGLHPDKSGDMRQQLLERPGKAGEDASGMQKYAYATLKERIVPFCALAQTPAAKDDLVRLPGEDGSVSEHYSYAYTKDEVSNLRPRCARLMPVLKRL